MPAGSRPFEVHSEGCWRRRDPPTKRLSYDLSAGARDAWQPRENSVRLLARAAAQQSRVHSLSVLPARTAPPTNATAAPDHCSSSRCCTRPQGDDFQFRRLIPPCTRRQRRRVLAHHRRDEQQCGADLRDSCGPDWLTNVESGNALTCSDSTYMYNTRRRQLATSITSSPMPLSSAACSPSGTNTRAFGAQGHPVGAIRRRPPASSSMFLLKFY